MSTEQLFSGFEQILLSAGFSAFLARAIALAITDDERIIELAQENKTPLIFMTQQDSKVDDKICLPLEGTVWAQEDVGRPRIPSTTHPNCRCFWINGITGQNLGQF